MPSSANSKAFLLAMVGTFLVLLSSFLIILQIEDILNTYWSLILLPLALGTLLFPISFHLYLSSLSFSLKSLTRFVLLFASYCIGICSTVLTIFVASKLDKVLHAIWSTVFIPVWFGLFIYLIFCCFMTPGLVNARVGMYRQTILLYVYFLGMLGFSVLIAIKLDCDSPRQWSIVYVPVWIVQFVHVMSLMVKCWPDHSQDSNKEITGEHTFLTYFIVQSFSVYFVLESMPIPGYVALLPLWLVMIHTVVNEMHEQFTHQDEEAMKV